jgi:hypothetical protein
VGQAVAQVPDLPKGKAVIAAHAPPAASDPATEATEARAQKVAVMDPAEEVTAAKVAVPTSAEEVADPLTAPSISSSKN